MRHDNDNHKLTYLSVCSGIEAASVAWHPLGWRAVAYSEIEKFPSAVLKHHYPDVPNLGDFTKIDVRTLGRVDILAGGTPCQAFSVAGLRQSLADARGNLSLEFVRLAHELADRNGLRNVVWENVVGVLSTKDNAFGCLLAGLVGGFDAIIPSERPADGKSNKHWKWSRKEQRHFVSWPRHGMVSGPKGRAAWAVKDAQFFGVAQRRRRVLVVADFGNGADPAAVLFEPEGVLRNPPSRGEAGKDVAPTISARTKGGGRLGTDFDLDGGFAFDTTQITSPLNRSVPKAGDPCHPLSAGAHPPAICFSAKDYGADASFDIAPTLRSGNHSDSHANGGVMPAIAFAHQAGGDGTSSGAFSEEMSPTLQKSQTMAVATSAVRRLTPKECERLQGFPDDYTAIPWRGKPADQCPDGPRYKALGNSWAVPKFAWLGRRIAALMPTAVEPANDNYPVGSAIVTPISRKVSHA